VTFVLFVVKNCLLKMFKFLGVSIYPLVKKGDVIGVSQTAVFRSPTGAVPGVAIPQKPLEDHSCDFSVRHQAVQVLVQIGLLMDLEIIKIGIL
jgi:hypothetical protein